MAAKKRKSSSSSDQDESKQSGTSASILSSSAAEVSFPRGGAGVLTPLERREIAIKAANDLFSEKPKGGEESEEPAKKKRKADKKKEKSNKTDAAATVETKEKKKKKKSKSVNELSFKRLTVGSVLFGCISQIHDLEMFVSLPGQLRGVVAITEISDQFTKAVEQVANQQSFDNENMEESQNAELPSLHQYFRLGQYVRCKVINMVNQDEKGNSVKRIELTLRPEAVNNAIMKRDVTAGVILSASVTSVEDHGYILNFGIDDLTGFCKHSDAKQYIEKYNNGEPLVPGQIVECSALQNAGDKRTVHVTLDQGIVAKSVTKDPWSNYTSIPAGLLVNGVISEILSNGLRVTFMGLYDAFVEMVHVPVKSDIEEEYKLNQKVKCRILYRVIDAENVIVGASLLPHIVNLSSPLPSEEQYVGHVYPFGTTLEEVTVTKIKPRGGVHVSITGVEGLTGFVHISNLSDETKNTIDADGPFKVGSKHRARVLGYNPIDAILLLSTKAKILSEKYLRVQDVPIGEVIEGTVKNFKDNGMNVAISSSINGFVPTVHLADATLTHPELKYKIGAKVKGRVLSIDPVKNRLMLTLKQSLVHSEWPIIKDYHNIEEGMTTHGVIFSIKSFGAFIRFYNNVTALCPASEMTETQVPDLSKVFRVGQSVKAYVKAVDPERQKLIVSLTNFKKEKREKRQERKQQEHAEANKKKTAEKKEGLTEVRTIDTLEEGYIGQGTITKVNRAHGLLVKIGTGVTGRVHRTDISDTFVDNSTGQFKKGMKVRYAIVRLDKKRKQVDLSLRTSRTDPDQVTDEPVTEINAIKDLSEGQVLFGYVDNISDSGVFVCVGRSVTVRVKIAHLSDEFVKEWKSLYKVGQLVKLKILEVDTGSKRAEGTLKRSLVEGVKPKKKKNNKKQQQEADDDEDQVMEDADAMETDEDEEEEEESDDEDVTMMDMLGEDDDEQDNDDEEAVAAPDADDDDKVAPLSVSNGFDWTGQSAVQDEEQEETESEDESDEEEDGADKKKKKKELVEDKTAELSTSAPQSIADFERLIVGSPNSSYIWINYMAYQLQLSEIDKAREIGERALSTISFREEQEKMNVWVAMLNLENTYGSDESLEQVFKRACTYCEPKKVYLQLLNIYDRSGKEEKALDLWKRTLKRFSQSSKVWTLCASFYIKHGKADEARELMTRCTHVLPKHKHIKTIVKFAQLEFRHGEVERGRTIFESLISDHPKRVDIWNIYLDMEITAGDQNVTRRLFERMTSMKLSSKKMKFVFKKWLQYEKEHGGEDDIERVKEKAMEFVNK